MHLCEHLQRKLSSVASNVIYMYFFQVSKAVVVKPSLQTLRELPLDDQGQLVTLDL